MPMYYTFSMSETNIQLVRSQCERGSFSSLFSWSSERQTYFRTKFIYNYSCFLDLSNDIIIGDGVSIAFKTIFINASHEIGPIEHRAGKGINAPIRIEDGCWIGANVTIMPGVTIAKGCIIGAGTLVTEDTEENGIYVGIPARLIRKL